MPKNKLVFGLPNFYMYLIVDYLYITQKGPALFELNAYISILQTNSP